MSASSLYPNTVRQQNEDTKSSAKHILSENAPPDIVDVMQAKASYKQAFNRAKEVLKLHKDKITRLDRAAAKKRLNKWQLEDYSLHSETISVIEVILRTGSIYSNYAAYNEAQAFRDIHDNAAADLTMHRVMQKRIDGLKKEVQELKKELADKETIVLQLAEEIINREGQ